MKKIDLHIHTVSTIKDKPFIFDITKLQEYIEVSHLDAIAITNHNKFDSIQFSEIENELTIPVFPGIEIDIEAGHLLLITGSNDITDFSVKCNKIESLITDKEAYVSEQQFSEIFTDLNKYILIPHYDKYPKLDLDRIPTIRKYITAGEVSSERKFISLKKKNNELVPVYFSDLRIEKDITNFSNRHTYFNLEEISLTTIKNVLSDKTKVSLTGIDGKVLFSILDNGLKISNGLTVVIGERSSGKTYTLDEIAEKYENKTYIPQFSLLSKNDENDQKEFERILKNKSDSISQDFLKPFKDVVDDIKNIDISSDDRTIDNYLTLLKQAASEAERADAFSKTKLFNETAFSKDNLDSLEKIIDSVDILIANIEYRTIIDTYIPKASLLRLAIELRKEYLRKNEINNHKQYINDIVETIKGELQLNTTCTSIPNIDLYTIKLNKEKKTKFETIVKYIKRERVLEQKSLYSYTIVATAKPYSNVSELKNATNTRDALTEVMKHYNNPYEFLNKLKAISSISESDYYKYFINISYEVMNKYGNKASGGERSEFNLLQKLKDALKTDILILDEPESSFDNLFLKNGVNSLLKEISNTIPVVIATHNNTIGASVHPDYLIYTKKEILEDGTPKFHLYSGTPTETQLCDLEGNIINRKTIVLDCLEAGEEAYRDRGNTYEISIH